MVDASATAALTPGTRLFSASSTSEFIVVRSPKPAAVVTIAGYEALRDAAAPRDASPLPGLAEQALLGKRYVDADSTVELLCTKGGAGVPAIDGTLLRVQAAKTLPASD